MGDRSHGRKIPQEDPQHHQLTAPQFICHGGGVSHSSFGLQQGLPQTCSVARALVGSGREPTARDRPGAQTSGPAFSCSCSEACGTCGKGWAGTARVVVNCTSTSSSLWHGFIPFPLVLLQQGLALGCVSWSDSYRWNLEFHPQHPRLAGGC